MDATYIRVWFEDKTCTYVCSHPNPTSAHAAIIATNMARVSSFLHSSSIPSTFNGSDFSWAEMGVFVSLSLITDLASARHDSSTMVSMATGLAEKLQKEISRKDIIKQRLGEDFTVIHKPAMKTMDRSCQGLVTHGLFKWLHEDCHMYR